MSEALKILQEFRENKRYSYMYDRIDTAIEELLTQPERDKIDFQTLNEMGLRRLQVSDTLVLQESCSRSPTLIFAENGNLIEIIGYKKLLEIRSFIDEILNYADTPQIGVGDMDKPVAWFYERQIEGFTERTMSVGFEENFDGVTIPLYLAPPTRETLREHIDNHKVWYQIGYEAAKQELERGPLSYEHLEALVDKYHGYPMTLGRAIEEAHGIEVGDE